MSQSPSTVDAGTRLAGVGVGRGGVVGPVVQVRPAPVVPADAPVLVDGKPAGDDGCHADSPQPPEAGGALQAPLVEVGGVGARVRHARDGAR
uniref:hypothetical protein n=1 Tax=Cellulomonas citrea TaxID=1909423 RepID=UPI001B3552DD